jgi:hypothetical protein
MTCPQQLAPMPSRWCFVLGAIVVLALGTCATANAQGLVQGVQQGAREGNKAAGPVGGVLGGAIGGVVGVGLAAFMQLVRISTLNWQSFAELAFNFTLTPGIAALSFAFSVLMGVVGGFLPAARAARLKIVDALRAA